MRVTLHSKLSYLYSFVKMLFWLLCDRFGLSTNQELLGHDKRVIKRLLCAAG